jgi:hypothetical protein
MTLGSVMDDLNVMMNLTKIKSFAQIVSFSFTIYVYSNDLKTFRNKLCITVVDRIMFHKNVFLVQELRNKF